MMLRFKRIATAFLSAVLLAALAAPAAAAAEDVVVIRTAEELAALSKSCTLDTWSQGKVVKLEADIDLSGADFAPIPSFGGTFLGQDHKISGLTVTGSGNVRGLFRYIESGASVQDLTVEGSILPEDRQDDLGLLAGVNRGSVTNCAANGTVVGSNRVGGLVGCNEAGGALNACRFTGSVTGKHSVGGVAGENRGTLTRCQNYGSINTRDLEDAPRTDYTNLQQLNAMENIPIYTDIGGVVGLSAGTVQSCANEGAVGYEYMGCNIGGVAGRSSGYLDGCVNSGEIRGKKDVGGVVGQLEPDVIRSFSRDFLDKLLDELEQLTYVMDRAANDADSTADAVSDQLDDLSARAHSAKDITSGLLDSITDWTNGNIDYINELAARVSWALDQLTPILESGVDALSDLDNLLEELDKVRTELYFVVDKGESAAIAFENSLDYLQDSVRELEEVLDALGTAMNMVSGNPSILADPDAMAMVLGQLAPLAQATAEALNDLDLACENMNRALVSLDSMGGNIRNTLDKLEDAHDAAGELSSSLGVVVRGLRDMVKELAEKPDIVFDQIGSDITDQGDALETELDGLLDSGDALNSLLSDSADTLIEDLRAVNRQFRAITSLIRSEKKDWSDDRSQPLEDRIRDRFLDESDSCDLEKQHDGRVSASRNEGVIWGETQVGGIAGSVGIETDFDLDEDTDIVGTYSLDCEYQARALVFSCVNTGELTARQDYVGGVVGRAYLGQVRACESYGPVTSTDGSYVGGLAGSSWGSLRGSWAKCALSGEDYVGGAAGYADTLDDCHTLISITGGSAYLGALAGDVDEDGTVTGNTFTHETLGALDGISYAGRAEPVSFDALCSTAGVPKTFAQLELTFVADGETLAVIPFQYGKGIDALPAIPEKKGCSAAWPELDYLHLTASQRLEAVYTPYSSALADGSGDGPAQLLVDGSFSAQARVSHTEEEVSWTDGRGTLRSGTAYTVTVDEPVLKEISFRVHFRQPEDGGRYDLWVQTADGWEKREYTMDGSYLVFPDEGDETITFCLQPGELDQRVLIAAVTAAVLLMAVLVLLLVRRRKRVNRIHLPEPTADEAAEDETVHS